MRENLMITEMHLCHNVLHYFCCLVFYSVGDKGRNIMVGKTSISIYMYVDCSVSNTSYLFPWKLQYIQGAQ